MHLSIVGNTYLLNHLAYPSGSPTGPDECYEMLKDRNCSIPAVFYSTGNVVFAATKTKALIRTTTGLWPFTDVQFIEI